MQRIRILGYWLLLFCVIAPAYKPLTSRSEPLHAQQLDGEAAHEFLKESGILEQLSDTAPAQGRTFLEPTALTASDYAGYDEFGTSVALDGDTALVGAWGADIGGNSDQGAVYFFERQQVVSDMYLPVVLR